jgi:LacI family transcriptional regulator
VSDRSAAADQPAAARGAAGGAPTIRDIAREAGVSRATVSLVLQESPLVADRTRERVRSTMARLRYRPSRMAASLRSKRSFILGLIVSDLTWPHYAQMAAGIERAVEGAGYSLLVANSHDSPERERRHVENLGRYRADGGIVAPVRPTPGDVEHLRALAAEGFPLVTLYREVPGLAVDHCGIDAYGVTRRLVAHLAEELGHRRVALVTTATRNSTNPARLEGWRDELRTLGLPAGDDLVVFTAPGAQPRAAGERAVAELLDRRERPTAVVCVNDLLALGALRGLQRAGVTVPGEVSVGGMSGFEELSPPHQALTTVHTDYRRLGAEAGTLLLRRLADPAAPVQRRLVEATLRPGESTGTAPS